MSARAPALAALLLAGACGETKGVILGEFGASDAASGAPSVDAAPNAGLDAASDAGCACPSAVGLAGASTTAKQGGTTGTAFSDICPGNQAVVGFRGFLTAPQVGLILVGGIQALCGELALSGSSPARLTTRPGATLPMRGTSQASPWTQACPSDQVVVGFSGRSGIALDQVAVACAPWTASSDTAGAPLSMGQSVTLTAAGGDGGSPYVDPCPAGQLARGSAGQSGQWVDAFGLVCATPTASADAGP
jgi:hypothetical protein